MSFENILASLEEYLSLKHDVDTGCADEDALRAAKKRFAESLNQYVDWRADSVIAEHKKKISSEHSGSMNALGIGIKHSNIAIAALNSAPTPPKDIEFMLSSGKIREWMKAYKKWYDNERKKGSK